MRDEIVLKVRGLSYSGWTSVIVEKSLRQMVGSFGLTTTDIYPGQPKKWNIAMEDECIVEINGQKVITGYMEDINLDYDGKNHNIQFGGRDKTGDLVDCSHVGDVGEWVGLSIINIIKKLCQPFGIDVVIDSSVTEDANSIWADNFKANEGDTIFDLISHITRMKAILPVSYGDGKLTLTRAGVGYKANDVLQTGKNILRGSLEQSNKDRFRSYIVKGQGKGDDDKDLPVFNGPSAVATDLKINRWRPTVIFIEEKADEGKMQTRAEWEKNNRAGNSRAITYDVQGWTQLNGKIWPLNAMVQVYDTKFAVKETLLISELHFAVNEMGTITKIRLHHPDAFTPNPTASSKIETGWEFIPPGFR